MPDKTDKKKTIKTIVLVLIAIIFLFMLYSTFLKGKKKSGNTALKNQPAKIATTLAAKPIPVRADAVAHKVSGSDPAGDSSFSAPLFNPVIPNIFKPWVDNKSLPKKEEEKPKPIFDAVKTFAKKIIKPLPLSDQEKESISQDLNFKGSILSSKSAVAIINNEFIHVGDYVNGYKVASISEQQVFIDTGRGTIILEIMTHE